jgi:hypothetical protein
MEAVMRTWNEERLERANERIDALDERLFRFQMTVLKAAWGILCALIFALGIVAGQL